MAVFIEISFCLTLPFREQQSQDSQQSGKTWKTWKKVKFIEKVRQNLENSWEFLLSTPKVREESGNFFPESLEIILSGKKGRFLTISQGKYFWRTAGNTSGELLGTLSQE